MKIIGLTGGIGSGKTTVAHMFEDLGIPVYIADFEAKQLMNRSKVIKKHLIALFGEKAYTEDRLNKEFIASKIFNDANYLKRMNAIVHPKVALHFKRWLKKQNVPYVIKESAIIFEHNMQSHYDYVIMVTSSKEEKIKRVLKRDQTTRKKILAIMDNQLEDKIKIQMSDFVIINDRLEDTKSQVLRLHEEILHQIKTGT